MIKIAENAHVECNAGGGYELFIDKYVNGKDTEGNILERKKRSGGLFYATLSGCLNGYVEEHLRSLAAEDEAFDLQQIRNEIEALKEDLTEVYNINFNSK